LSHDKPACDLLTGFITNSPVKDFHSLEYLVSSIPASMLGAHKSLCNCGV
jgi:hypothetical protein